MPDLLGEYVSYRNYGFDFQDTTDQQTVFTILQGSPYPCDIALIVDDLTQDTRITVHYGSGIAYNRIFSQTDSRSDFDPDTDVVLISLKGMRLDRTVRLQSLTAEGAERDVQVRVRMMQP